LCESLRYWMLDLATSVVGAGRKPTSCVTAFLLSGRHRSRLRNDTHCHTGDRSVFERNRWRRRVGIGGLSRQVSSGPL
jgi:hypothetical protein